MVEYTGTHNHVKIICKKCTEELERDIDKDPWIFELTPHDLLQGHGCPRCNGVLPLTVEEVNAKLQKIHNGNIVLLDKYISNGRSIGTFKCLICGINRQGVCIIREYDETVEEMLY